MTKRDRITLAVLGLVVVLGAFFMLALKPLRAELSALDTELTAEQDRLVAAQAQAAQARTARDRYVADYAAVARLGKAVPADDDLPALLYQLQAAAEGAKIDFTALKLAGASTAAPTPPATATPTAAAAAAGGTTDATGTAAGAPAAPAAPTTPAQAATAGLPPGATVGAAGIATMPFTFQFEGSFLRMQRFLERVQRFVADRDGALRVDGRLLTIDGIGIGPGTSGFPSVKASLTATAYVLPLEQGLTAGATPQTPAAGAPAPGMTAAPPAPGTATAQAAPPAVAPVAAVSGGTP